MTTATFIAPSRDIAYNPWAEPLYVPHGDSPYDYMLISGGRGSSKTYEVSQALIVKAHQKPLRIAVAREHLKSISESAKPELEARITALGLWGEHGFRSTQNSIDHANGSHIFFIGLSRLSEEDIKGLAMVDIVWIEEAHRMSAKSWELLVPTIRKYKAQIWATWNNQDRTDAIARFKAVTESDPLVWHKHVIYTDNIFFTERNERDRLREEQMFPERYAHIWLGEFDDHSGDRRFLTYALADICHQAFLDGLAPEIPKRGAYYDAGLDLASTGPDFNALVVRWGPTIVHASRWHEPSLSKTARKADEVLRSFMGVKGRLHFDLSGLGMGARVAFDDVLVTRPYLAYSFQAGSEVGGKDEMLDSRYSNGAVFSRRNAQAWYWLRHRAENTRRLVDGEKVDPIDCLFLDPNGIEDIEEFKAQLSQPKWKHDTAGRMVAVKADEEKGERSPDLGDAAMMAFAADTDYGIRLKYAEFSEAA